MNNKADYLKIIAQLPKIYRGANIREGLKTCAGDPEMYFELLQVYIQKPEAELLEKYFTEKNTYEYQVCIHGIKSASRSIGFESLAESALELEQAAQRADWDFIRTRHSIFLDEYQLAVAVIKKLVSEVKTKCI